MPFRIFFAYNVLGATLWVAVWAPLGYLAGDHIGTIYATATSYSLYLLIALVLVLAFWIARAVLRRRRGAVPAATTDLRDLEE
jgi:membrane protein DedA with SNARE-associated domain